MAIPTVFSQKGSDAVASYDWLDVTSGVGYRKYYLAISQLSGSNLYFMTPQNMDASTYPYLTGNDGSAGGLVNRQDLDFDIEFKIPAQLKGDLIFNITHTEYNTANTNSSYVVANIYHVKGVTETLLATASSPVRTSASTDSANPSCWREALKMPITLKKFAVGDKLRVNVLYYFGHNGAGTGYYTLYLDPTNHATTTPVVTESKIAAIDAPFKIDI
jgi:hypothetical protein